LPVKVEVEEIEEKNLAVISEKKSPAKKDRPK
jgi:hypothetical protein